jgi:hypothetical protein
MALDLFTGRDRIAGVAPLVALTPLPPPVPLSTTGGGATEGCGRGGADTRPKGGCF